MSMKIHYICHACLLVDTGDVKIVSDPWFHGPAYCGQWHVFPKPVNTDKLSEIDAILISHGHQDHLHEPTLKVLPKSAQVFYPMQWYGGTTEYLRSLGFAGVTEAISKRKYRCGSNTRVTFLANNMDTVVVIESGGRVLVNVNDALHAYPRSVIDLFVGEIRKMWPRIDVVFCGYGGASYFPNNVHLEGKDDLEVARVREQFFVHNFCRIVYGLRPAIAVPFAADFALLQPHQLWINGVRFPKSHIPDYFSENFGPTNGTKIVPMFAGDVLDEDRLQPDSPYRAHLEDGNLVHLIQDQYMDEIARAAEPVRIPESDAVSLQSEILENVRFRSELFDREALGKLIFCVTVSDVPGNNCYNIFFDDGRPTVTRDPSPRADSILRLVTSSHILRTSFGSEWGGDVFTIGYGGEIFVIKSGILEANLDVDCIRLLTRHPRATQHWKKEPIRMVRFLASNPTTRSWALKRTIRSAANDIAGQSKPLDELTGKQWLLRSKCELCRICDLPLVAEDRQQLR